jgi:hypothetical protein
VTQRSCFRDEVIGSGFRSKAPAFKKSEDWGTRNREGNGTLLIPDLYRFLWDRYICLILGVILFSAAVVWTYKGKAWARFHGWVYRAEEPIQFWLIVAVCYLGGVLFIGMFLYNVN